MTLSRKTPMVRGTSRLARSPMARGRKRLGPGKQTRLNLESNARLKAKFDALGIRSCELGLDGCQRNNFLTWAHGRKRRKLVGDELDTLVILICQNCHSMIEVLPAEDMLSIVQGVIAAREGVAA